MDASSSSTSATTTTNSTRRIPQVILLLVGVASFVLGTFFQLKPRTINDSTSQWQQEHKQVHDVDEVVRGLNNNNNNETTTPSPETAASTTAAATTDAEQERCKKKLDQLDIMWDKRRDARRQATFGRTAAIKSYNSNGNFDFFEPEAVCYDDERFGSAQSKERYMSFGDGPKFVCGVDRIVEKAATGNGKNCLIYSVGSNNQIEFETAIANTMGPGNCEVHTFDPTIAAAKFVGNHVATFHEWGFGPNGVATTINHYQRGQFNFTQISLLEAMTKLNHINRTIDIFKIDCEGCEFIAMTEAFHEIAAGKIKINQVQIEVHGYQPADFPNIKKMFEAADAANMRVFHKEGNSWGCNGYLCVEYAFVSKEFLREANGYYLCDKNRRRQLLQQKLQQQRQRRRKLRQRGDQAKRNSRRHYYELP